MQDTARPGWPIQSRVVLGSFLATLLVVCWSANEQSAWGQVFGKRPSGDGDDLRAGIFSPAPRETRQALLKAQKLIDEQRYAEAIELLRTPQPEDFFLGRTSGEGAAPSLKSQTWRMLGALPPKGRDLFELSSGVEARKELEAALEQKDFIKLAAISRDFFHTKAGYDATFLLGRWQLDRGEPLAAALTFQRLAESPTAATRFNPELSLLTAICWQQAGRPEVAKALLAQMSVTPQKIRLGGKSIPLFTDPSRADTWLAELLGKPQSVKPTVVAEWVMFRGDEARNGSSDASFPLLNYRWSQPLVYDRYDEERIKKVTKDWLNLGNCPIPALQPLVVGDLVLMRTPDRLVGVDLTSGKAQWVYPWDETSFDRLSSGGNSPPRELGNYRVNLLRQRLWEDNTFGQVSSDGKQVFLIDDLGLAGDREGPNVNAFIGRNRRMQFPPTSQTNRLVALNLRKQGALRWIVGGTDGGDEPKLAGAHWLGAPLPSGDKLYVLAEFSGEIRLVCLDAFSGQLEWKQSLAMVADQPLQFSPLRQVSGASPSLANGLLVCPTTAGGLVAMDLTTRRLLWGFQYPRSVSEPANDQFNRPPTRPNDTGPGRWLDSCATLAEGAVIATPLDSQQLFCLDLLTGKPKWPAIDRSDLLYVGCVHAGKIILIGKRQVKAIQLADGKSAWNAPLDLPPGETPSGRGYYSDHYYYLPVTNQQLLKIDLTTGTLESSIKTQGTLGNLVCYKEDLISQSSEGVTAFYLSDPLKKRIDQRLADNPQDVWALARLGEVLLQEGKAEASLATLRKASSLEPTSDAVRSLMVRVMLILLSEDYPKQQGLVADLDKLTLAPSQRQELLRIKAVGLQRSGALAEAFEALLEENDQVQLEQATSSTDAASGAGVPLRDVTRDLAVHGNRWTQARLVELHRLADEAAKARFAAAIQQRLAAMLTRPGVEPARKFLAVYGFHPLAEQARGHLIDRLLKAGLWLEAEMLVGENSQLAEPQKAAQATAQLATIYTTAGRPDLVWQQCQRLATEFAAVDCGSGQTGMRVAAGYLATPAVQTEQALQTWAFGKVEVNPGAKENVPNPQNYPNTTFPVNVAELRGPAPRLARLGLQAQAGTLRVKPAGNLPVYNIPLRGLRSPNEMVFAGPGNFLTAKQNGNLLLLPWGSELLAVDLLRQSRGQGEFVLWRQESNESDPNNRRALVLPRQRNPGVTNPLLPTQLSLRGAASASQSIGPLTQQGLCFLKGRQLIYLDPLTGKSQWERSGIEAGSELFGDNEVIVVASSTGDEAHVFSTLDGTLIEKYKLEPRQRRWTNCGRHVLTWQVEGTTIKLALTDSLSNPKGERPTLWRHELPLGAKGFGSKGYIINGEELALLEPTGAFQVVSLRSGKVLIQAKLKAEKNLENIYVQKSLGQYLVLAQTQVEEQLANTTTIPLGFSGVSGTPFNGRVYALHETTGEHLWPAPAFVAQQGWLADQPADSPVLIFARNQNSSRGSEAARAATTILVLDRRDGSLITEQVGFSSQTIGYEIEVNREKRSVAVTMQLPQDQKTLTLQWTLDPAPPSPPAQTGPASSLTVGQLSGRSTGVTGAIFRALDKAARPPGANEPLGDDPFGGPFK